MPAKPRNLTYQGETRSLSEWSESLDIPLSTIVSRLKLGWSVELALGTPPEKKFRRRGAEKLTEPPQLKLHRASGQARVCTTYKGRRVEKFFGVWGEDSTRRAYAAFCRDWFSIGPLSTMGFNVLLLSELAELYLEFVEREYTKRGEKSSEVHAQKATVRILLSLYGDRDIPDFGVDQFRQFQRHMAEKGYARKTIRDYANRVLQMIRFGAERGHVRGEQWDRLRAARKIRRGAGIGVKTQKRKPVPDEQVTAIFPHLDKREPVRAMLETMIRLQRVIGLRPIEICVMRPADIDRNCGEEWRYTVHPDWNKLDHLEQDQEYYLGPRSREILLPLLEGKAPDEFLFHLPGKSNPVSRLWYGRKIKAACEKAGIPVWNPHRLRHSRATEVLNHSGSFTDAAEAIGDTEEVARRNYTDSESIRRRIARESG